VFATVFVLLYVAHLLADYVLQTDHQADHKADRTPAGWYANISHATTHVAACAATLVIGWAALDGVHLHPLTTALALAWVGLSHGFIDRRWPIAWWMNHTGSNAFYTKGGAAYVDQTAHIAALFIAALIFA
jgi:hypothetical protein